MGEQKTDLDLVKVEEVLCPEIVSHFFTRSTHQI